MLSIIVPVFNASLYIERNYKCLLAQTSNDFEVIYIDDGSTDDSLIKLRSLKNDKFNIHVLTKENGGVSSARNMGLDMARGDYVFFLDIDDEVVSTFVEKMSALAYSNDADIVACSVAREREDADDNIDITNYRTYLNREALYAYLYKSLRHKTSIIRFTGKFKEIRFKEGYKYGEDIEVFWRQLGFSNKVLYLEQKLYIYYINPGSATANFDYSRVQVAELMENLESYFDTLDKEFAQEYKKYCVPRIWWSLLWQSAVMLSKYDFLNFYKKYNIKYKIKHLIFSREIKVSITTLTFLLSSNVFRFAVGKIRKKGLRY